MKSFIFLILAVNCSGAFAQRNTGTPTGGIGTSNSMSLSGGNDAFTYGKAIDLDSYKYSDVSGSPFLKKDYTSAYLVFKHGSKFSNIPFKFEMLHN